jgi:hypothetical protein
MAISVKKALEKYGVTANAFNATQETIMREGAKAVTNAAAVLAVFETWQTAIKEDKNGGDSGKLENE